MMRLRAPLAALVAAGSLSLLWPAPTALACGCFTPPDPSVPVVQAGERILFAQENGVVTAHIQIQYAGNASEFGWLLPLPSVPVLELGTDEVFTTLTAQTQPKYRLQRNFQGDCAFNQNRGGPTASAGGFGGGTAAPSEDSGAQSPLVIQDSIGPYDYAVLRADSKAAMLAWLDANRYFVPAGTDATVGPYIRPGAYFLALKLRSGKAAGDLQPVVLRYPSDLPMIPIVLTSVAAQPNMGIQVWMLGGGRAIPRNYYHTVVNDTLINWFSSGSNYNDAVIRAVTASPDRHAFVTEYAGSSSVLQNLLDRTGRFGTTADLARQPDAVSFVNYLGSQGFAFTSQLVTILTQYIPVPPGFAAKGISAAAWLQSLGYYSSASYQRANAADFQGWAGINYQPEPMSRELQSRVVVPTLAAGELFRRYPYLTRLYTTLSPEDMNKDPVFSYNASLPSLSNVHQAVLTYFCDRGPSTDATRTPARLVTEQGFAIEYPAGTGVVGNQPLTPSAAAASPGNAVVEILREEGPPEVVTDNRPLIAGGVQRGSGCATAGEHPMTLPIVLGLLAAGLLLAVRRKRNARD